MKRAAAYARYSSDVQSDTSIEAQLEKIRKYCQEKGYVIVREYIDRAQSATTDKREAFQKMFQDAEKNIFDIVVVYKLDRFARNLYDSVVYTKKLEDIGIALESATEPITHDIAGKFFRNIMSAINELYIENLKQELRDKAIVVAKKGYHMGGQPPFGYKLVEVKDEYGKRRKRYVIDEEEAKIVIQIFEWAAQGYTLQEIADRLNSLGIKTRRGGEWRVNSLYDLLRNKKYIGVFVYNKGTKHNYHANRNDTIEVPGAIPPIISEELWERVRERFPLHLQPAKKRHNYPLKGILVCGVCGSPMSAGTGGNYPSYMCLRAKREHLKGHIKIGKKKIETYVFNRIRHEIVENVDFEILVEEINKEIEKNSEEKQKVLASLNQKLLETEEKIRRGVEAIMEGIEIDELKEELERLKKQKLELQERILSLTSAKPQSYITAEQVRKHWDKLKTMLETEEGKEALAKNLLEKVVIYSDGYVEIVYRHLGKIL